MDSLSAVIDIPRVITVMLDTMVAQGRPPPREGVPLPMMILIPPPITPVTFNLLLLSNRGIIQATNVIRIEYEGQMRNFALHDIRINPHLNEGDDGDEE
jgi:hypothetical protein